MKIGVDVRVLMDKQYSGVSEYAANLLSEILRQDSSNEYRLFYNNRHPQEEKLSPWQKNNSEIKGLHYPNKLFNYCLQKVLAWPKIDSFLGNTEIVFSPHLNFLQVSKKAKLVVTVHDLSFLRYPEFFSRRKNFWHSALGIKKLLARADRIVAVSQNTKCDLVEVLGLSKEKIKVIYSGNNYRQVAEQGNVANFSINNNYLSQHQLQSGFILFLGNVEPRKNIIGLIHAYESLRNRRPDLAGKQLVIAGRRGWKSRRIFAAGEASVYKNDIKFLGYVSRREKEILYQSASIFVYPSFYEGFGFPPLEAISFGLPTVSSNVSSLPELLGKAALLVDPFNIKEISDAMEIALTDEAVRSRLVTLGKEQALTFSWLKTAQEYLELFKELHEEGNDKK